MTKLSNIPKNMLENRFSYFLAFSLLFAANAIMTEDEALDEDITRTTSPLHCCMVYTPSSALQATDPWSFLSDIGDCGQVITSNGSGEYPSFQGYKAIINVFTTGSSGVYTPTDCMQYVVVEAVGGGGGTGGSAKTNFAVSAGAGAGGYSKSVFTAAEIAVIGATVAYVVGTGGTAGTTAAGAAASSGATTTFGGTYVVAKGGLLSADGAAAAAEGGAGGAAGTGTIAIAGMPGGVAISTGSTYSGTISGAGGNSFLGAGGAAQVAQASAIDAGTPGAGFGGGAGGSSAGIAAPAGVPGGTGAAGVIIITEYVPA